MHHHTSIARRMLPAAASLLVAALLWGGCSTPQPYADGANSSTGASPLTSSGSPAITTGDSASGTAGAGQAEAAPAAAAGGEPAGAQPAAGAGTDPTAAEGPTRPGAGADAPAASSPNAVAAAPEQPAASLPAAPPIDWQSIRYAFYDETRGSAGSQTYWSSEVYLTGNPNFCVSEPGVGLVGGVLDQNEQLLYVHLDSEFLYGGPEEDAVYGVPRAMSLQALRVLLTPETTDLTLSPNVCRTEATQGAFTAQVSLGRNNAFGTPLTFSEVRPAGFDASTPAPAARTLVARKCAVSYAEYLARAHLDPLGTPYSYSHGGGLNVVTQCRPSRAAPSSRLRSRR